MPSKMTVPIQNNPSRASGMGAKATDVEYVQISPSRWQLHLAWDPNMKFLPRLELPAIRINSDAVP